MENLKWKKESTPDGEASYVLIDLSQDNSPHYKILGTVYKSDGWWCCCLGERKKGVTARLVRSMKSGKENILRQLKALESKAPQE